MFIETLDKNTKSEIIPADAKTTFHFPLNMIDPNIKTML